MSPVRAPRRFVVVWLLLAVLAGVASLALSRQSFELAVLKSRGFTRAKLLGAQAAQTVVTAIRDRGPSGAAPSGVTRRRRATSISVFGPGRSRPLTNPTRS